MRTTLINLALIIKTALVVFSAFCALLPMVDGEVVTVKQFNEFNSYRGIFAAPALAASAIAAYLPA